MYYTILVVLIGYYSPHHHKTPFSHTLFCKKVLQNTTQFEAFVPTILQAEWKEKLKKIKSNTLGVYLMY